jgi:hypothetical protein
LPAQDAALNGPHHRTHPTPLPPTPTPQVSLRGLAQTVLDAAETQAAAVKADWVALDRDGVLSDVLMAVRHFHALGLPGMAHVVPPDTSALAPNRRTVTALEHTLAEFIRALEVQEEDKAAVAVAAAAAAARGIPTRAPRPTAIDSNAMHGYQQRFTADNFLALTRRTLRRAARVSAPADMLHPLLLSPRAGVAVGTHEGGAATAAAAAAVDDGAADAALARARLRVLVKRDYRRGSDDGSGSGSGSDGGAGGRPGAAAVPAAAASDSHDAGPSTALVLAASSSGTSGATPAGHSGSAAAGRALPLVPQPQSGDRPLLSAVPPNLLALVGDADVAELASRLRAFQARIALLDETRTGLQTEASAIARRLKGVYTQYWALRTRVRCWPLLGWRLLLLLLLLLRWRLLCIAASMATAVQAASMRIVAAGYCRNLLLPFCTVVSCSRAHHAARLLPALAVELAGAKGG